MLGTVVSQVLFYWCPLVAEMFLGVEASEPPEAHVHGLENFVHHGFVGDGQWSCHTEWERGVEPSPF